MNNNKSNYSFVHSKKPMGRVAALTTGTFKEIFEDHSFNGGIERIVLEFTVLKYEPQPSLATPELGGADVQPFWYMPLIYQAFNKPKQFLLWELSNSVAQVSLNMLPSHFRKQYMQSEEYVDFVVKEAEVLAKAFGLQVEIVYHGDPFYARKYLQQQPQQHREKKA